MWAPMLPRPMNPTGVMEAWRGRIKQSMINKSEFTRVVRLAYWYLSLPSTSKNHIGGTILIKFSVPTWLHGFSLKVFLLHLKLKLLHCLLCIGFLVSTVIKFMFLRVLGFTTKFNKPYEINYAELCSKCRPRQSTQEGGGTPRIVTFTYCTRGQKEVVFLFIYKIIRMNLTFCCEDPGGKRVKYIRNLEMTNDKHQ